ncbi:pyrimidine/purine nucleoside phosphorylase [uncultured Pseudoteredinibacter sp.]|uniref:pyrimidine/purine nucleoside phosphorylase n=1 Tax=uncultured Pseudoteredinibacter sp. TaxID=1641701 RepID=UPI0026224A59|nr:pyrimidine/purine nucleoside phosphorylase [uncultured Pseudoteredinibacter sp.]
MSTFENVSVVKAANIYFDGKVVSRTVLFPDGSKKTLGLMLPGDYTFDTEAAELMEVLAGKAEILLPGDSEWKNYAAGDDFNVPANSSFSLKVSEPLDYCCSYL